MMWRLALAGGVLPSIVAFLLRLQIREPERNAADYALTVMALLRTHWQALLGACVSWFAFNFVAYSQASFSSTICDGLFGGSEEPLVADDTQTVARDAKFSLVMYSVGALSALAGMFLQAICTRTAFQASGFIGMAVTMFGISRLLSLGTYPTSPMLLLYALYISATAIVGITTYLIPSERFPAAGRATAVGVAAASGKIGGFVGTAIFPIFERNFGIGVVLFVSGLVSCSGVLFTLLLTPDLPTKD